MRADQFEKRERQPHAALEETTRRFRQALRQPVGEQPGLGGVQSILTFLKPRRSSGDVPWLSPDCRFVRPGHPVLSLFGRAVLVGCLLIGHTAAAIDAVPSSPPGTAKGAPSFPVEDGLTRQSLTDPQSQPAPPTTVPASTAPGLAARRATAARARAFRRHRRRLAHVHHAPSGPRVTIFKTAPRRRNPAARFVYWWNGWVIRTLHTKVGTVMLGTIGAQT